MAFIADLGVLAFITELGFGAPLGLHLAFITELDFGVFWAFITELDFGFLAFITELLDFGAFIAERDLGARGLHQGCSCWHHHHLCRFLSCHCRGWPGLRYLEPLILEVRTAKAVVGSHKPVVCLLFWSDHLAEDSISHALIKTDRSVRFDIPVAHYVDVHCSTGHSLCTATKFANASTEEESVIAKFSDFNCCTIMLC